MISKATAEATEAPRTPHPRQLEFLKLDCEEALYGGAGGGGKTWTLLRWLAEGAHIPGYSGIFFRRTYPLLKKSNDSPIAQSHAMYRPLGGRYSGQDHCWVFPSGARIEFGHLQYEDSIHNYSGPAFHRICFDELTQFSENQYTFLFSRIRKKLGFPITCGMRAASNPGGRGHFWVRSRFVTDEAMNMIQSLGTHDPSPEGAIYYKAPGRAFVPSRVADNPVLDVDEYVTRLREKLSPVLAAQIAAGDWRVSEGSLIDIDKLRYYSVRGDCIIPLRTDKTPLDPISVAQCKRFATLDTAGTSKDKAAEDRGRQPSWSVCGIWDYYRPLNLLFLRHIWRGRVKYSELEASVRNVMQEWNVSKIHIENAHFGQVVADALGGSAELIGPKIPGMGVTGNDGSAKLERATAAGLFGMLEKSQFFLPDMSLVPGVGNWVPEYENEILAWSGREGEVADQVDVTSYAVWLASSQVQIWSPINTTTRTIGGRVGLKY